MKRVVVRLTGGLGNQMFQIAVAKGFEIKYGSKILLDTNFFKLTKKRPGHTPREFELQIFEMDYPIASNEELLRFNQLSLINKFRRTLRLNYPHIFVEKSFEYDENIESIVPPIYLKGFFQSYKYFENYKSVIRESFAFPIDKVGESNLRRLEDIRRGGSVAVHIRRGDYVDDKGVHKVHGNCQTEYYLKAISAINKHKKVAKIFFFSDDIEWVKKEFDVLPYPMDFVVNNTGSNSWKDMFLMSNCDHNVISNSSFSWWAAWLNSNPCKMVVAPKVWFAQAEKEKLTYNLIPPGWLRL